MATSVTACTHCERTFKVAEAFRGRRARCRACGGSFVIQFKGQAEATPAESQPTESAATDMDSVEELAKQPALATVDSLARLEKNDAAGSAVAPTVGGTDGGSTSVGATTASPSQGAENSASKPGLRKAKSGKAGKKNGRADQAAGPRRSGYRKVEGLEAPESAQDVDANEGSGLGSQAAQRLSEVEDRLKTSLDSQRSEGDGDSSPVDSGGPGHRLPQVVAGVGEDAARADVPRYGKTQGQIDGVLEELRARDAELAEKAKELDETREAVEAARLEQAEQQQRADAARIKADQAEARLVEWDGKSDDLESKSLGLDAKIANLEEAARAVEARRESSSRKLQELDGACEGRRAKLQEVERQVVERQQRLAELGTEIVAGEARVAQSASELEQLADALVQRVQDDESRRSEVDSQLRAGRADIEKVDKQRSESERALAAQRAQAQKSEEALGELQARVSNARADVQSAETALRETQEERRKILGKAQQDNDRLVRENAEFELRLESLAEKEKALQSTHVGTQSSYARLQEAVVQLEGRHALSLTGVKESEVLLTDRRAELAREESHLEDRRTDLVATETQLEALTAAVKRARGVHDELVQSTETRTRRFEVKRDAHESRLSEIRLELDQAKKVAVDQESRLQDRAIALERELARLNETRDRATADLASVEESLASSRQATERDLIAAREARSARDVAEKELVSLEHSLKQRIAGLEVVEQERRKRVEATAEEEVQLTGRRDKAGAELKDLMAKLDAARSDHAQVLQAIKSAQDEARQQFQRAGDLLSGLMEAQRQAGDPGKGEAEEPEALDDSDIEDLDS
jgi:DNA repair exonuclease SbcCD ATPase subunit